jgi:hypothetical protein
MTLRCSFLYNSQLTRKTDQLSLSPPDINKHILNKTLVFVLRELLPNSLKVKALARSNITSCI